MLYAVLGVMLLVAILTVVLPLFWHEGRLSTGSLTAIVVVILISGSLYYRIGSPGAESGQSGALPEIEEMVAGLAQRLQQDPDDLAGWKLLGRSYVELKNFPGAIAAYERAIELESGRNGQTLSDLGETLLLRDPQMLNGRSRQLFESALAVEPGNQKALFYAGMAAVQRGDGELGASYWETLLAGSPPENIRAILREQIAQLRGQAPPTAGAAPGGGAQSSEVITVRVSLDDSAAAVVPADSTVFIIARDPAQPSPPIAAVRRKVNELPAEVTIGDSDAMIPGRVPSGYAQLEIIARVSMSGEPIAQSGDWFGQQVVTSAESSDTSIVIAQQVP